MRRFTLHLMLALSIALAALPASAAVNVERQGNENAFIEVARTVSAGAATGLLLGSAIAWAEKDGNGDPIRWGFVIGTFAGLGYGIYHVNSRPRAAALLEFGAGPVTSGGLAAVEAGPRGVRVRAVSLGFN